MEGTESPVSLAKKLKSTFPGPVRGHFFSTRRNVYFFDANTTEIVKLDGLSESILRAIGMPGLEKVVGVTVEKAGAKAAAEAIGEIIRQATERNPPLFSCRGPEKVMYHYDFEIFRKMVSTGLQQMVVSLTDACNLACRYCCYSGRYSFRSKRANNFMSRQTLDRAIDHFIVHSAGTRPDRRCIGFYGGEPLLAFEMIRHAVKRVSERAPEANIRFNVTTNLAALRPEMIQFFHRYDFGIYVSLDGPKTVHDRYRVTADGKPTHDVIMNNLGKIRDYDPEYYRRKISFTCVAAPPYEYGRIMDFFGSGDLMPLSALKMLITSVDEPERCFDGCGDPGFLDHSGIRMLKNEYHRRLRDGSIAREEFRNKLLKLLFDREYLKLYRRAKLPGPLAPCISPGGICVPGERKVYVRWDGEFFPCERVPEIDAFNIGDCCRGVDVEKAFKLCVDFIEMTASDCRDCWNLLMCGDSCFKDAYRDGNLDPAQKRMKCGERLRRREISLKNMLGILEDNPRAFEFLDQYLVQ